MELRYKKPIYDPFEVFKPPKSVIINAIKYLNSQCNDLIQRKITLRKGKWPVPLWIEADHKKTLSRINHYKYRLRSWTKLKGWTDNRDVKRINESDVQTAKGIEIDSLYTDALRRRGKTYVGRCPFHEEKTASFTIYIETNRWRCFGCNLFGDSIDYIINRDRIDFISAIKILTNHFN